MLTKELQEYYQNSKYGEIRPELKHAISISSGCGIAIDCGCGAGANIGHLISAGFEVCAFDVQKEAVSLCDERYASNSLVSLSVSSFGSYVYPKASLIVADASLFFCPAGEFDQFMEKVQKSLQPDGVFYGSFLGARDSMASPDYKSEALWGDVLIFSESKIKRELNNFEIHKWVELEVDGFTPTGEVHHWHLFIVVAKISA